MVAQSQPALDVSDVEALTFDCYGTLVDWERGILTTFARILAAHGLGRADAEVLELFGRLESRIQATGFRRYRDVLGAVASGMASELGFSASDAELSLLADELGSWPLFADTRPALERLAQRFRLAIVSNVDDELFAQTQRALGVRFDEVVTAEQLESYKPERAHFDEALRRLALEREQVVHVAQSLFHDIAPACSLGITTVWVRRGASETGGGATPMSTARPDYTVADLAGAAELLLGRAD